MDTPFQTLSEELERFVDARDWQQFHTPRNMATCIAVEAGELLEHYTWTREGTGPFPKGTEQPDTDLVAAEAADIFMSLLSFCRALDIDLLEVTRTKLGSSRRNTLCRPLRGRPKRGGTQSEFP